MSNPKSSTDYSVAQKIVHWLMSILIIMDLFVAQKLGGVMEDWDRFESRSDHASLGTIVAVLFLVRLYLRYRFGAPALPASMSSWQVYAARWGHTLLYVLIGLLIGSGLMTAVNASSPVVLFGALDITVGRLDENWFETLRPFHEFATIAIITLIGIHTVAALYHHFIVKDQTLVNMLKFWVRQSGASYGDGSAAAGNPDSSRPSSRP